MKIVALRTLGTGGLGVKFCGVFVEVKSALKLQGFLFCDIVPFMN
jgi:hypothetical protein